MNCGFIGAGKLGMPTSLATEYAQHSVLVHDPNPAVTEYLKNRCIPYREEGIQPLLNATKIRNVSVAEVVAHSEIIFVAVQTPHSQEFEGVTKLGEDRKDFDYSYLVKAVEQVSSEIDRQRKPCLVVVISTVLPGTMRKYIIPRLSKLATLCYSPHFMAMGTVVRDFYSPEFTLIGSDGPSSKDLIPLLDFWKTIHNNPLLNMSIESAELLKVAYNLWISTKITAINAIQEIAHGIPGCDIDDISAGLSMATERLVSTRYMKAGNSDGGSCHPRDAIAMSWLVNEMNLPYNFFDDVSRAREGHTEWFADLIEKERKVTGLPVTILGKSFKPETNICTGSPAVLLANILKERGIGFIHYDPFVLDGWTNGNLFYSPNIYFIATKHAVFQTYQFPKGSVVLDPHRYILEQEGVRLVPIGVGK